MIMERPIEGEKDVFQNGGQNYIRIHLAIEPTGYLGVVTDVTKDIVDKKKMRYDNDHDQLTGLLRYKRFQNKSLEAFDRQKSDKICACVMMD